MRNCNECNETHKMLYSYTKESGARGELCLKCIDKLKRAQPHEKENLQDS